MKKSEQEKYKLKDLSLFCTVSCSYMQYYKLSTGRNGRQEKRNKCIGIKQSSSRHFASVKFILLLLQEVTHNTFRKVKDALSANRKETCSVFFFFTSMVMHGFDFWNANGLWTFNLLPGSHFQSCWKIVLKVCEMIVFIIVFLIYLWASKSIG